MDRREFFEAAGLGLSGAGVAQLLGSKSAKESGESEKILPVSSQALNNSLTQTFSAVASSGNLWHFEVSLQQTVLVIPGNRGKCSVVPRQRYFEYQWSFPRHRPDTSELLSRKNLNLRKNICLDKCSGDSDPELLTGNDWQARRRVAEVLCTLLPAQGELIGIDSANIANISNTLLAVRNKIRAMSPGTDIQAEEFRWPYLA